MTENAILERLEEVILRSNCLDGIYGRFKEFHSKKIDRLQSEKKSYMQSLKKIKAEIEDITNSITKLTHEETLKILEKKLLEEVELNKRIEQRIIETKNDIIALKDSSPEFSSDRELFDVFWKGWKKANLSTKRDLIRNIFEKVVVSERGLEAHFVVF